MEQKDISVNVSSHNDGYWEHFIRNDPAPYEVTGKYLFFSTEQNHLVEIAIAALERGSFHQAKVGRAFSRDQVIEKNIKPEYVLCLYYKDESRKHELAKRYCNQEGLRYRYWKSNEATRKGEYSEQFLQGLPPGLRKAFQREKKNLSNDSGKGKE